MIIAEGWNDQQLPPERHGAMYYRVLPDGRDITVYPLFSGYGQLALSSAGSPVIDQSYHYPHLGLAILAAASWSGDGDPMLGWIRHVNTGRRREGGDPSKETIRR